MNFLENKASLNSKLVATLKKIMPESDRVIQTKVSNLSSF